MRIPQSLQHLCFKNLKLLCLLLLLHHLLRFHQERIVSQFLLRLKLVEQLLLVFDLRGLVHYLQLKALLLRSSQVLLLLLDYLLLVFVRLLSYLVRQIRLLLPHDLLLQQTILRVNSHLIN